MNRYHFLETLGKAAILASSPRLFTEFAGNQTTPIVNGDLHKIQFFPSDSAWNKDIYNAKADPNSKTIIGNHTGQQKGFVLVENVMYYNIINNVKPSVAVVPETGYEDTENPKLFPIDSNMAIQNGSFISNPDVDHHLCIIDNGTNKLYELYQPRPQADGSWLHRGAAMFDLNSSALRTAGMTSADAAGLPILPGLIRYDELLTGSINHALRMTLTRTLAKYISPATHLTTTGPHSGLWAPMGARFRLRRDFDDTKFSPIHKIITKCLKHYGAFVADNGTNFALQGTADTRFQSLPYSNYCCLNLCCGDLDDQHVQMSDLELVAMSS